MKHVILALAFGIVLSACGHDSGGKCLNCDVYPHPNGSQKARVESSCERTGFVPASADNEFADVYTCKQFSPACQVTVQQAPVGQSLPIFSTCPSFP